MYTYLADSDSLNIRSEISLEQKCNNLMLQSSHCKTAKNMVPSFSLVHNIVKNSENPETFLYSRD